jgi:hypothetical protein
MHGRLADELSARFGKDHHRIGRALGVFFHDGAKAVLHMGLQRFADVDLFSADLIAHVSSRQELAPWTVSDQGAGAPRIRSMVS